MKNNIVITLLALFCNYAQPQDSLLCVGNHWSEDEGN